MTQQNDQMNAWIRQRMRERTPTSNPSTVDVVLDAPVVGGSAVDRLLRNAEDEALRSIATHMEFQRIIRRMGIVLRNPDGRAVFASEYTECMQAYENVPVPASWHNFCMCWLWASVIEANISVDGRERLWYLIFHAANDEEFNQIAWIDEGMQDRLPPAYVQNLLRPQAPQAIQAFTDPSLGEPYPAVESQPMSGQSQLLAALASPVGQLAGVENVIQLPLFAELITAVRSCVLVNGVRATSAIECIMDRLRMQFESIEASDARIVNTVINLPQMLWFIDLLSTRTEAERALLLATFQSSISDRVPAATQPPCAIDQFVAHGTEYVRIRSLRSEIRAEVLIRSDTPGRSDTGSSRPCACRAVTEEQ